jgi:hypothetical protein
MNSCHACHCTNIIGATDRLAADVLEALHEQVMEASARGRRLAARAKKLEAAVLIVADQEEEERVIEGVFLHRLSRWPKVSHGVVAGGDLPCFITEYISKCRGPPALSILDKYDAGGDGACLRRYTDPSFFFRANSAKVVLVSNKHSSLCQYMKFRYRLLT